MYFSTLLQTAAYVTAFTLYSYVRGCIVTLLQADAKRLMWAGFAMYTGTSIGAITIFLLVDVFGVLVNANPCH